MIRYLPSMSASNGIWHSHPYAWTLTMVNIAIACSLCAIHVHAERNATEDQADDSMNAWTRISSGPYYWSTMDKIFFWALIMVALEILNYLCGKSGAWMNVKQIPVRGKHLDDLSSTDRLFIGLSKAQTGPFLYFLLRYCFHEPNVLWSLNDASLQTILLPLPAIFIIYDFFYTILHWFLHIKAVYPLIHKHHHHQKAPSRATDDAVNVHPVEFTLGEYNHLWAIYLFCHSLPWKIHIAGVLLFLATGGVLAGWNHTRFDISFSLFGLVTVFDSKVHDVHHRIPQSNYGQYTMFWDKVFGTYRPYDPTDRVNPKAQLDPHTGKSLNYVAPPSALNSVKEE